MKTMRSEHYRYKLADKLQLAAGRLKGAIQQDDEWLYEDVFREVERYFQELKEELVEGKDIDELLED